MGFVARSKTETFSSCAVFPFGSLAAQTEIYPQPAASGMGNRGPVMDRLRLPWGLSRPNPIHQELLGAKVSANKAGCFLPGLPHCIPRCQLCFSFSQLGFPESWRAAQSGPGTNHPSCWSRLLRSMLHSPHHPEAAGAWRAWLPLGPRGQKSQTAVRCVLWMRTGFHFPAHCSMLPPFLEG